MAAWGVIALDAGVRLPTLIADTNLMGGGSNMSNNEMAQMPQYQCHKKVWALKIAELKHTGTQEQESDGSLLMIPENKVYLPFILDAKFVDKHKPKEGGYYVVYDDGYTSFSPAQAFESGYTLLE